MSPNWEQILEGGFAFFPGRRMSLHPSSNISPLASLDDKLIESDDLPSRPGNYRADY